MRFLPIVDRELRVAARQRGTFWIRVSAALIALLIGGWVLLIPGFRTPKIMGTAMFVSLGLFAMVYAILAGLRTTSDCLSEEKREGTLGLLFLTDLKGHDIVFGKLFATSLNTFYGLLAMFPVLAIPLMLGGVAITEFTRVLLCCLNNIFFSLAMGMFCSAISKDERKSMVATFLLLLFFVGGLPLLGGLLTEVTHARQPLPFFFIVSPGYMSFAAFDETYRMLATQRFNYFQVSFVVVHLMSWGLIGLACYIVPRTWKDAAATPGQMRRRERLHRIKHGDPHSRALARAHLLDKNPIYWLTSRDRLKTVLVWAVLGLGGLIWIWGLSVNARDWKHEGAYITSAVILHTIFKCWIALEAARRFGLDRKSGALELILSTPITVKELVVGQLGGLARQFFWPALCVLLVDFLFLTLEADNSEWVFIWVVGMGFFVLDLVALSLLSMWRGFATGNPGRGAVGSIFLLLALPWILFAGVMTVLAFSRFLLHIMQRYHASDFYILVGIWSAISLACDLAAAWWAWRNLTTRFRALSSQQTKTRRGDQERQPIRPGTTTAEAPPPMPAG